MLAYTLPLAVSLSLLGLGAMCLRAWVLWLQRGEERDTSALSAVPMLEDRLQAVERRLEGHRLTLETLKTGRSSR